MDKNLNTDKTHKSTRVNSSGHLLVYRPDNISSYKSGNWKGYIYEHRFIMELHLGRVLTDDEEVHHLNCNPSDNRLENLVVLSRDAHVKLHLWINNGAPRYENSGQKGMNSGKPTLHEQAIRRCAACDITLSKEQVTYCSRTCYVAKRLGNSKCPPVEVLKAEVSTLNFCEIGRKYEVSDNAVRKWVRKYIANGVWQS